MRSWGRSLPGLMGTQVVSCTGLLHTGMRSCVHRCVIRLERVSLVLSQMKNSEEVKSAVRCGCFHHSLDRRVMGRPVGKSLKINLSQQI